MRLVLRQSSQAVELHGDPVFRIGAGVVVAFYRVKGDAVVVDNLYSIVDDVFMDRDGIRC